MFFDSIGNNRRSNEGEEEYQGRGGEFNGRRRGGLNNRRSEPRMGGNRNFSTRDSVLREDNGSGYNNRNSERDTRDFSSVDRGKILRTKDLYVSPNSVLTAESQSSNEGFNNRRRRRQKNPPSNSKSLRFDD